MRKKRTPVLWALHALERVLINFEKNHKINGAGPSSSLSRENRGGC